MTTDFTLLDRIGSGSYGTVYSAKRSNQLCAAKQCYISHASLSDAAINREIQIFQQLRHRHIIQYYGCHQHDDGRTYILMDLAERGNLAGAIVRGEVADWVTKKRLADEIARGLEYIHGLDIQHRDLKTANVLLTRFMEVKLCDFGLAKVKTMSASASTDSFQGTVRWCAPEILAVRPKFSAKSDVYGLGMVMWAMAANRPEPFYDHNDNDLIATLVKGGHREVLPEDTPTEYRSFVERCWHQSPEQRPEASEVVLVDSPKTAMLYDTTGSFISFGSSSNDSLYERISESGVSNYTLENALDSLEMIDTTADDLYSGGKGPCQGKNQVVYYLRRLACEGNADAQLILGWMCCNGVEAAGAVEDGALWYRKSAEQGHSMAQLQLGLLHEYTRSTDPSHNDSEAAKWYRMAAERGEAQAQFRLGLMCARGRGLPQSDTEAVKWFRLAALQGISDAQFNLGLMYIRGQGMERNDSEGVAWMRRAAEQGKTEAQFVLGSMYEAGRGIDKSYEKAAMWYHSAAESGYAEAQLHLGLMYRRGHGVPQSIVEAAAWIRKSADHGHPEAQVQLAIMHLFGRGVERNGVEAVAWLIKAADQEYPDAEFFLGVFYRNGFAVEQSEAEAAAWFLKAANRGYVDAQESLGLIHLVGNKKSYTEAMKWFTKASDQGSAIAQFCIGIMYKHGYGVVKSEDKASAWFRMAADQGQAEAQEYLGSMYRFGTGVNRSYTDAVFWYRRSADQGYAKAQFHLGEMYEEGTGVEQSYTNALTWYRKAATQGYSHAQASLGWLYDRGLGTEQSDHLAIKWYSKSVAQGHQMASFLLGSMYDLGFGVKRNHKKAFGLFRRASGNAKCHLTWFNSPIYRCPRDDRDAMKLYREGAAHGYAAAQYNLARMYERGRGSPINRREAWTWYAKSATGGVACAVMRLGILHLKMEEGEWDSTMLHSNSDHSHDFDYTDDSGDIDEDEVE